MKKIYFYLIIVVFLFGNLLPEAMAQNQIVNNGNLRFGTGTESSINATGNVKQPFYFNPSTNDWRKLTFSNFPLDYSFAVGGTGSSEWNLEGTRVDNPIMASQTFDDSGFTYTSGQTGWGVLKVKGNISVGSAVLEVENTYELLQDKKFTQVTTVVKNISGTSINNLRFWIGTRDDYVGIDDRPRKQKGNLSDGAFEQVTSMATRAAALLISSGNEGILFYTTSQKGNTIIQSCCNWLNVINQNPSTSSVDITGDGSYGFYVRMNDLGIGETDEFTWFYAAAPLDELEDVISDVAAASSSVTNITAESATLNAKASINGIGYWVTIARGAATPTPEQVKAGINYGDVMIVASGSGAVSADVERAFDMTGLSHDTAWDTYFVAEDDTPEFTALTRSQFRTLPVSPTGITATATDLCSGGSTQLSVEGGYGTVYWYSVSCGGTQLGTGSSITVSPGTTTSYYARNFSNNFSETCASVEITVHPFPAAPTAGNLATEYNGNTHTASATAPEGSSVVWYSAQTGTLETTAPAGSNAGTYSAWAASVNNTAGCESTQRTLVTLTISPKILTVVSALVVDKNYDGNSEAEIVNATLSGVETDDDVVLINNLNGNFAQNNVGSDIQVTTAMGIDGADADNYLLQQPNLTGSITPRPVAVNVDPEQSKVYGEQDPNQLGWYITGSLADGETFEGELMREQGEPVGSYAIQQGSLTIVKESVVTMDNYHFVFIAENFTVSPAELFVNTNNESKTYGNSDPTFSVNYSGFVNNEDESVLTGELAHQREQGESSGLYAITSSGLTSENYSINFVDGELEITPAELIITAHSVEKIYGDSDPVFSVSYHGFAFEDDETALANNLEIIREPGEQTGIYAITPSGFTSQDYAISFVDGQLQIHPAALQVTTNNTSKIYGESDPDFSATFTGFAFEETESVLTGELSFYRTPGEDAGNQAVTPSGLSSGNYTISFMDGQLEILPAELQVIAENSVKTYGETDPVFNVGFQGFVFGENESVLNGTLEFTREQGENTGLYSVTPSGLSSGNYSINFTNGLLGILPTELVVTASSAVKVYGQTDPVFSSTYSGFAYNEDESVLTGELTYQREQGESTGFYAVTPLGLSSENYAIEFVEGELEVSPAELLVTVNSGEKTYGDADPVFSVSYQGFAFDDNENHLLGNLAIQREVGENTGDYRITASGLDSDNYNLVYNEAWFTIAPALLKVKVADTSKIYGNDDPEFILHFSGFAFLEDQTVLEGTPVIARAEGENVGVYTLSVSGFTSHNYVLEYIDGELKITARPLYITGSFEVADKEFDGTPNAQIISNTLRLSGGLKKDELKLGKVLAIFESTEPAEDIVVRIADATFSGQQRQNYELLLDNSPTTLANIFIVYYQLELHSNMQDAGQITGAGSFEAGKKTALTAVANPGYLFLNWTDEEGVIVSSEAEFKYTMPDRSISLTANFDIASTVQDNPIYNVRLYPNPSSSVLNVETDSHILYMAIADITGRRIKTLHENGQGLKSVDVSDLPSGIYILFLTTEKGTGTYKINVKN